MMHAGMQSEAWISAVSVCIGLSDNKLQKKSSRERSAPTMELTSSRISQNDYNRNMAADSLSANWRCADNSTAYTQMRIHCVRN